MATEKSVLRGIISRALAKGFTVSLFDGEEWVVRKSRNAQEVIGSMFTVDEETLRFCDADGVKVGDAFIVHGNSPEEVVCDHTDSDVMTEIIG